MNYQQELSLWLQQYKTYPRRLKRRRIEGEVIVAFTISRNGALLDSRIVTSSGVQGLDDAALELLIRAAPFPTLPPDLKQDSYSAELPIVYSLQ